MSHVGLKMALLAVLAVAVAATSQSLTLSPTPINLCFAIDESGSINTKQFRRQSASIAKIVEEFSKLSPNSAYSAVGFSTVAETVSPLTKDRKWFVKKIAHNKRKGGNTASGSGLRACHNILKNGNRPGVIVLLSHATDNRDPKGVNVAPSIQQAGVSIATVAVGSGADEAALADIATSPSLTFVAQDFLWLLTKKATKIATELAANVPPPPPPTPSPINLCFAIDESSSINSQEFQLQSAAIVKVVEDFSKLRPSSAYSAVGFWSGSEVVSPLTKDRKWFVKKIVHNKRRGGLTSSGAGLRLCFHLLKNGNLPNVIVLLSDGRDTRSPKGVDVAPWIKQAGVSIVTVAIGNRVDKAALTKIATRPSLAVVAQDFRWLLKITANIARKIVQAVPSFPKCGFVDCARCGAVLECYVNSGSRAWNWWASRRVANRNLFCRWPKHSRTICQQSCEHLSQGIRVLRGRRFASCPRVHITSVSSCSRCLGGGPRIGGRLYTPQNIRSFASYRLCRADSSHLTIRCVQKACKSGNCICRA